MVKRRYVLPLTAHETDTLSIPVPRQVEAHTTGQAQAQRWSKLEESVAKICGDQILFQEYEYTTRAFQE
jgi:hypothetical protein